MRTVKAVSGRRLTSTSSFYKHNLYGMEIELENCPDLNPGDDSLFGFDVQHDGSLRGRGAVELISTPLSVKALSDNVADVYKQLGGVKDKANIRTSIHIHANMLPYNMNQAAAVAAVYALAEPYLMHNMFGSEREQNIYCVPWYRSQENASCLRPNRRNISANAIRDMVRHQPPKYSSLYVGPLGGFGTLEFRAAPVFLQAKETIQWLKLVDHFVETGVSLGSPEKLLEHIEKGSVEALYPKEIAGDIMEWAYRYDSPYVVELLAGADDSVDWDNVPIADVEGKGEPVVPTNPINNTMGGDSVGGRFITDEIAAFTNPVQETLRNDRVHIHRHPSEQVNFPRRYTNLRTPL